MSEKTKESDTSKPLDDDLEASKIMMQEYTILRQEIVFYNTQYKSYIRYFQAAVAISVATAALFLRNDAVPFVDTEIALVVIMFVAATVVGLVCSDILESQFSLIVLGSKLSVIETVINRMANRPVLTWESMLSPVVKRGPLPAEGVINPNIFVIGYGVVIVAMALFSAPIYWLVGFRLNRTGCGWVDLFAFSAMLYALVTAVIIVVTANSTVRKTYKGIRLLAESTYNTAEQELAASRKARAP